MITAAAHIIGGVGNGFDCTTLRGYTPVDLGSDGRVGMTPGSSTSGDTPAKFEGWAGECKRTQDQTIQSFALLAIILIILAAAAVLYIVRQMS